MIVRRIHVLSCGFGKDLIKDMGLTLLLVVAPYLEKFRKYFPISAAPANIRL
jgi:hypothetical protein